MACCIFTTPSLDSDMTGSSKSVKVKDKYSQTLFFAEHVELFHASKDCLFKAKDFEVELNA